MKKFLVLLCVALVVPAWSQAPAKYALVIGNGSYTNFGTLGNPENDANDMAAALESLGFTVDKVINGNLSQMEVAALRLRDRLMSAGRDAYGFFYYAGHGIQVDGLNYLIPANASIPSREFLRERALSAQTVLDILNGANNALNIAVLDACRDFPAAWTRSMARGLAVMHPPTNSIVIYATAAGRTASDGEGRNGLFTSHLLTHLKTPGLEVNEVFRRTMSDVARASGDGQRPAMYTDFADIAYLGTGPAPVVATVPVPEPVVEAPPAQAAAVAPAPRSGPATAAPAVPPARVTKVTFENSTGYELWYLYVSERTKDTWGSDVLGDRIVRNGSTFTVSVAPGEYDVQAKDQDGDTYTFWIEVDSDGGTFSIVPEDLDEE